MTEKRFKLENEDGTICIKDNIRKKYIFAFVCEDIDMQEGMLEECENVVNCLNQTWEQTQRFEKYNQEYITENEKLKKENKHYKYILQDLGLLMTDEEVRDIRIEIADKFINPLCKENGFDVDVDCTNGFTIIPKR